MTINVTKEWINNYIASSSPEKVEAMVGRALVGLLSRQTREEASSNTTNVDNGIGFTGADGYSGAITAKSFIKNGKLLDWQLARWTKNNAKGDARISKYWRQLNEIAIEKAAKSVPLRTGSISARQALQQFKAHND